MPDKDNTNRQESTGQEPPVLAVNSKDQASFNEKLDTNVSAMQALLGNLASKVELAEREAQSGDNSSGALAPQESVGDALKDIMLAEKALGSFETQLDSLLDRLDELIDEAPESKNKVTS